VTLSDEPLSPDALAARVGDPEHGAVCTFVGTTRRDGARRPVVALEYEAYRELAEVELRAIAAEAGAAHAAAVAIAHRVGRVPLGEPSVVVAAGAPHRGQAFDACRQAIDELKRRVPIWKREVFEDGASAWVQGGG
jgi:molybdopterin synthase catalytic subunit